MSSEEDRGITTEESDLLASVLPHIGTLRRGDEAEIAEEVKRLVRHGVFRKSPVFLKSIFGEAKAAGIEVGVGRTPPGALGRQSDPGRDNGEEPPAIIEVNVEDEEEKKEARETGAWEQSAVVQSTGFSALFEVGKQTRLFVDIGGGAFVVPALQLWPVDILHEAGLWALWMPVYDMKYGQLLDLIGENRAKPMNLYIRRSGTAGCMPLVEPKHRVIGRRLYARIFRRLFITERRVYGLWQELLAAVAGVIRDSVGNVVKLAVGGEDRWWRDCIHVKTRGEVHISIIVLPITMKFQDEAGVVRVKAHLPSETGDATFQGFLEDLGQRWSVCVTAWVESLESWHVTLRDLGAVWDVLCAVRKSFQSCGGEYVEGFPIIDEEYLAIAHEANRGDEKGESVREWSRSSTTSFLPLGSPPPRRTMSVEEEWLLLPQERPTGMSDDKETRSPSTQGCWPEAGIVYGRSPDPAIRAPLSARANPAFGLSWLEDYGKTVITDVTRGDSDWDFVKCHLFNDLPDTDAFPDSATKPNPAAPAWCKGLQIVSVKKLRRCELWKQHWECAVELAMRIRGKQEVADVLEGSIVDGVFPVTRAEVWEDSRSTIMQMANRHWLWHGTSKLNPLTIAERGFDVRFARKQGRYSEVSSYGYLFELLRKHNSTTFC